LENKFSQGSVYKNSFVKREGEHILVQINVDDIIFGSTSHGQVQAFSIFMKIEFEISMMGEMAYLLRFQVKQFDNGLFISQNKFAHAIAKNLVLNP